MARHQYGYRHLFDGDAKLEGDQRYDIEYPNGLPSGEAVLGVAQAGIGSNSV